MLGAKKNSPPRIRTKSPKKVFTWRWLLPYSGSQVWSICASFGSFGPSLSSWPITGSMPVTSGRAKLWLFAQPRYMKANWLRMLAWKHMNSRPTSFDGRSSSAWNASGRRFRSP